MRNLIIGGIFCVVGTVVTVGSYAAASGSAEGGSYVIAWGAILFGGIQALRGVGELISGS